MSYAQHLEEFHPTPAQSAATHLRTAVEERQLTLGLAFNIVYLSDGYFRLYHQ